MYRDETAPRVFFEQPVLVRLCDALGRTTQINAQAKDLSSGGMFLKVPLLIARGTELSLSFALPSGIALVARGVVLRAQDSSPVGIAVRFSELLAVTDGSVPSKDERHALALQAVADLVESYHLQREPVRLQIDRLATPLRATKQAEWDNVLAVDAELPFLRLGADVQIDGDGLAGQIRWVSIKVCPNSRVPRLNIGIELDSADDRRPAASPLTREQGAPPPTSENVVQVAVGASSSAYARPAGHSSNPRAR